MVADTQFRTSAKSVVFSVPSTLGLGDMSSLGGTTHRAESNAFDRNTLRVSAECVDSKVESPHPMSMDIPH
jgi:hypothetical protein